MCTTIYIKNTYCTKSKIEFFTHKTDDKMTSFQSSLSSLGTGQLPVFIVVILFVQCQTFNRHCHRWAAPIHRRHSLRQMPSFQSSLSSLGSSQSSSSFSSSTSSSSSSLMKSASYSPSSSSSSFSLLLLA